MSWEENRAMAPDLRARRTSLRRNKTDFLPENERNGHTAPGAAPPPTGVGATGLRINPVRLDAFTDRVSG